MAATAFEDEILALNPEYDLVFSKNNENSRSNSPHALEPHTRWSTPHTMKIISKMNEIINAKPLGELPTQQDWEDNQSVEIETISLMRKLGLEQSIDRAPDEKRTISTVPVSEDVIFMKNGRKKMSIFMSDTYFELKPRSEPSFDLDEDATPEESTTSDFSDEINLYQPIFESSRETESTSLSADDLEEQSCSRVAYQHLDSGVSSDSGKRKSHESGILRGKPPSHHQKNANSRTSYIQGGSKSRFNDSGSSNTSNSSSNSSSNRSRSNNSWRSSNESFSKVRDENNWRLNITQAKEPEKQQNKKVHQMPVERTNLNQTTTLSKETPSHDEISNCGRALYKPKDLFMKKKAMMIQQVLAEYQS